MAKYYKKVKNPKEPFTYAEIRRNAEALQRRILGSKSLVPYDAKHKNPKTPHLRQAISIEKTGANTITITVNSTMAPQAVWLEEGTKPHDIPNAFGRGKNYGIGGRFDGKFHPGSTKQVGWVEKAILQPTLNYYTGNKRKIRTGFRKTSITTSRS